MDSPIQKGNSEIVKHNTQEMISTKNNSDFTKNLGLLVPERSAAKKATTQIKKTEKVLTPKPNKTKSETRNELRAKLLLLGLSRQGNKETLLARLQEYENNKIKTELQSPNASTNLSNIKKTILLDRLKEHHESNQKWDDSFEIFQKKSQAQ